ncbi:MAG: sigma-70 family RNA polymerase sigma factor [Myxococcota bacterium]|nr:sigma-70 family RNA polymerase sigma factor [Myxococcota bacterium]
MSSAAAIEPRNVGSTVGLRSYRDATDPGQLVLAAQDGDSRALDRLLAAHYALMKQVAMKYCRDEELANDAVQDACVQVVRHIGKLREPSKFRSWMARIVVNCVRLQYRKTSRSVPYTDTHTRTESDPRPTPDQLYEERDELDAVYAWLREYRPEDVRLFGQLFITGDSLKEISRDTGLSIAALKTRVHRLRKKLRVAMEQTNELPLGSYRPSAHAQGMSEA